MMPAYLLLIYLAILCIPMSINQANAGSVLIDDRGTGTLQSSHAGDWRLVTDQVMGGRSSGELVPDQYLEKSCLRMRGQVSTANNGGFVQMALDLAGDRQFDASAYDGIELVVAGNNERYNIHLRTSNLWLPWQSYRASFVAEPQWRTIRVPFSDFEAYRTSGRFRPEHLIRIGLVAIGREFEADLCFGGLLFYRNDATPGS